MQEYDFLYDFFTSSKSTVKTLKQIWEICPKLKLRHQNDANKRWGGGGGRGGGRGRGWLEYREGAENG